MTQDEAAATPTTTKDNPEGLSKNALKKKLKAEYAAKLKAEKEAAKVRIPDMFCIIIIDGLIY